MIKVLGLALYGPLAASNRYRLGHYVPGLLKQGINLTLNSLLDDAYLKRRFGGNGLPFSGMLSTGWQRIREMRKSDADLFIMHAELFPLMPAWFESALLQQKPYIYDFDDAFYLKYRLGRMSVLSPVLGKKFDRIISGAAAVTAGNTALQAYAGKFNARSVFLPTVVDTERYVPAECNTSSAFTIGWIGSPSTAPYLQAVKGALSRFGENNAVRLVVIGGKAPDIPNIEIYEVDWDESTEVALINQFDVGIMPLPDDEWARGKCAFKLIQYMACAVPVIGSRVGANIDVVTAECGFLAVTELDWLNALTQLQENPAMAKRMGEASRNRIEQQYSLKVNAPVMAETIINAVEQR